MFPGIVNDGSSPLRSRPVRKISAACLAWRIVFTAVLSIWCAGLPDSASAAAPNTQEAAQAASGRMAAGYARIPLSFEGNVGQTDSRVQFQSRGSGYSLFLTPGQVVLNLEHQQPSLRNENPPSRSPTRPSIDTLR